MVSSERGMPQVKAGQARWAQEVKIQHAGKTCRADYVLTVVPFTGDDRKGLHVTCALKPHDPLPFDLCVRQGVVAKGLPHPEAILPRRDGLVERRAVPRQEPLQAYWFLGSGSSRGGQQLALPLLGLAARTAEAKYSLVRPTRIAGYSTSCPRPATQCPWSLATVSAVR